MDKNALMKHLFSRRVLGLERLLEANQPAQGQTGEPAGGLVSRLVRYIELVCPVWSRLVRGRNKHTRIAPEGAKLVSGVGVEWLPAQEDFLAGMISHGLRSAGCGIIDGQKLEPSVEGVILHDSPGRLPSMED
jgi:hypothetical protein